MNKNTPEAPQSSESASESPVAPIVGETRGNVTESLGIQIFPAERLLGEFDMEFDPALARLGVAMRHYVPYGFAAAVLGVSAGAQPTFDEETDAESQAGLDAIR